jgi:predicted kinase
MMFPKDLDVSGYHFSKSNEKAVLAARDDIVRHALASGKSVIIDDTNFGNSHINRMRALAEEDGGNVQVSVQDFTDVPLKQCLEYNLMRRWSVPEKVIKTMHTQHIAPLEAKDPEYSHTPDRQRCAIFDLDGTLAIMNGRNPYDGGACETDLLSPEVFQSLVMYLEAGFRIVLLSGRNGKWRPETERWLEANNVPYDHLFMRAEGDDRKDTIIKIELLEENVLPLYDVEVIFDDRDQVVEGWRSYGLKVYQVNDGDF